MSKELQIEALSTPYPKSAEELTNIVDTHFNPVPGQSLVVLPEYFIDGSEQWSGTSMNDPMVEALRNFARTKRAHVVAGMVEETYSGDKYIQGLLITPRGSFRKQGKVTPTPFEQAAGVMPWQGETQVFKLDNQLGKLAISICIESFSRAVPVRQLPSDVDIVVNPRGFDLEDPRFGSFTDSWLTLNRALAMTNKEYVVGATGDTGGPGHLAEIIGFEGNLLALTTKSGQTIRATADLDLLQAYRKRECISHTVPEF